MRYGYYFLSRTGVKLLSGVPESLSTSLACFRVFSKVSPHRRHVFGRSRKSPDIADTFSGIPESLPTSLAQFRGIPKNKKLKMGRLHPFVFHLFNLFNFSPLFRGEVRRGCTCQHSVKRLKRAFGNKSICAMGIIYPELA
ncbi:hypothetical protein [Hoylesella saccharolytica]|uniref:hypothetical protein n=1 Tax=Hoylesella saccharolytica TaxID=633701 RepID=UPI0028E32D24|nr:hypothetical protein [Hoylesella saccharolytica]